MFSNTSPIYYQIMDIDGNFLFEEDGIPLCGVSSSYTIDVPNAALSSDGCALVCWAQEYDPYIYQRVVAQKIDSEGNKLWNASGVPVSTTGEWEQINAYVCSDESGGAYITFAAYDESFLLKAYVQRIDVAGNLPWGEEGTQIFQFAQVDEKPSGIVPDGEGNAIIVSSVGTWMTGYDIVAAKVLANGDISWISTICDTSIMYQDYLKIMQGHDGYSIIAWRDSRNGNHDIYAQKVDNDGACMWAENGIPVILLDYDQYYFDMVGDDEGFVHFVWADYRNGIDADIFYQKLTPDGQKVFAEAGLPVSVATDAQYNPKLAIDGAGGVIITWEDYQDDEPRIYAVHLDSDGLIADPVWNENGNPVSGTTLHHINPYIVSDNHGGALIAWEDYSGSGADEPPEYFNIYAQRVNDFSVNWAKPGVSAIPAEYSLSQNYPNPFNPSTTFSFSLPKAGIVTLTVYDITGREVAKLVDGYKVKGLHEVTFDADGLSSGVYFARLEAGEFKQVRKILLIK